MQLFAFLAVISGIATIVFAFTPVARDQVARLAGAPASNRESFTMFTRIIGTLVGALFLLIAFTYFLYGS
jgi:hypothetical protein